MGLIQYIKKEGCSSKGMKGEYYSLGWVYIERNDWWILKGIRGGGGGYEYRMECRERKGKTNQ